MLSSYILETSYSQSFPLAQNFFIASLYSTRNAFPFFCQPCSVGEIIALLLLIALSYVMTKLSAQQWLRFRAEKSLLRFNFVRWTYIASLKISNFIKLLLILNERFKALWWCSTYNRSWMQQSLNKRQIKMLCAVESFAICWFPFHSFEGWTASIHWCKHQLSHLDNAMHSIRMLSYLQRKAANKSRLNSIVHQLHLPQKAYTAMCK